MTSDDTTIQDAARERLFDAELADAVQAVTGAAAVADRSRRGARLVQAALLLLGIAVTIAALVLRERGEAAAQDPDPFDPLFPRVETEWVDVPLPVQFHTQAQLDALPEQGPATAAAYDANTADALARQPGVRCFSLALEYPLQSETWRRIGAMRDLEMLRIYGPVTAADLRELRNAPRLQAVTFGKPRFVFDEELAAALVELPHLTFVMFSLTTVRPEALARLDGLPHLQAMSFQSLDIDSAWLAALSRIRTLRWLTIGVDTSWGTPVRFDAEDLRRLAKLSKLRSLRLSGVSIAEDDIELLPNEVEVLGLHLAEPLTATALRTLIARPNLRGLVLAGLEPDAERTLCELLPHTKLERLGLGRRLSQPLWQALEQVQTLRWLGISTSGDGAAELAHCARFEALEQLDLSSADEAYDVSVLRSLPRLRRVTIASSGHGRPTAAEVEVMRAALAPRVELFER